MTIGITSQTSPATNLTSHLLPKGTCSDPSRTVQNIGFRIMDLFGFKHLTDKASNFHYCVLFCGGKIRTGLIKSFSEAEETLSRCTNICRRWCA